jgi:hydrogenase nickel incorporation protein HypA/HybF
MSLASSMMNIIDEYAQRYGFSKVSALRLSFGALSGIDEQALKFAFEVISMGTRAEGAELEVDIRPIVLQCLSCGHESQSGEFPGSCPLCASDEVVIAGGTEELRLLDMDVDEAKIRGQHT